MRQGARLRFPCPLKHMSFDGRLLHGAPALQVRAIAVPQRVFVTLCLLQPLLVVLSGRSSGEEGRGRERHSVGCWASTELVQNNGSVMLSLLERGLEKLAFRCFYNQNTVIVGINKTL